MDISDKIKAIRYQIDVIDDEIGLAENKITELNGKKSGLMLALKVLESDE